MNTNKSPFKILAIVSTIIAIALAAANMHLLGALREARRALERGRLEKKMDEYIAARYKEETRIASAATTAATDAAIEAEKKAPLRALAADWDEDSSCVQVSFSEGCWFGAPVEGDPYSFVPPVKNANWGNSWFGGHDTVRIRADFEPETLYTITLAPGWRTGDKTLDKPVRLSFKSGRASPSFTLAASGKYYPASREHLRLPYTAGGVTNLHVTVGRVYDNDVPLFGMARSTQSGNTRKIAEVDVPISGVDMARATKKNGFIDLGAMLKDPTPGIYFINIETSPETERNVSWDWEADEYVSESHEVMFALTDLAIQFAAPAAGGAGRAAAFVTAFGTGLPVAGAEVTVMTRKHQVAGKAVTDESGLAYIDLAFDEGDLPSTVTAAAAGDFAAIDLGDNDNLTHEGNGVALSAAKEANALVFSERELCRPGEKFESAVFARTSLADGATALAGAPADLRLIDPSGETAGSQRVTTDAFGFARAEWLVPKSASLGVWRVVCEIGGESVGTLKMRVATYRPDRVKAEIRLDTHEMVGLATPLKISGSAKYYFGEPLTDGSCRLMAAAEPAEQPRRWKGWHVGTDGLKDRRIWSDDVNVAPDGSFSAFYPGPTANDVNEAFAPVEVQILATAQEPSGSGVVVGESLLYHPTPDYIGVREANDECSAFDFAVFPALATDKVTNAAPLDIGVTLTRHYWERHLEKGGDGRLLMRWEERHEKVDSLARTLTVPAGEAASWTGRLDYAEASMQEGHYTMEATCGAFRKTVFDFWHWAGEAGSRSSSPSAITIEAGAPSYAPGGKAVLVFRSPFDGTACIVAGATGVDSASSVAVTQGVNKVEIEIPATVLVSRYHASVTLVADEARESPRLSGMAAITIDNSRARRLDAAIELPESARPNATIPVTVKLRDGAGNPAAGMVRLAALDEGVAALTDFHVADAYAYFFKRKFDAPFSNYDCFGSIFPDLRILPDGTFGGDGISAANKFASMIKEKETVRIVMPPIEVGEDGVAKVDVAIPDHLGALRFMAIAAGREAVGSCEDSLVVRDKVSVLPAAPRFAAAGDRFTLTAQVFNHDADEGDWTLAVALPEGLKAADGAGAVTRTGHLAKGQSKVVTVEVAIAENANGAMDIPLTLTLGDEKVSSTAIVNVRPPRPAVTRIEYIAVTNGATTINPDAADWIGKAKSTITLHASPAFAISDSLSWLANYPYGCLEQTVSGAFPFVVAADLEKIGAIDEGGRAAAEVKVKVAYAEILGMRFRDGGFGMWPWWKDAWSDGSLYANHFIFEARKAGMISPPKELIDIQRRWLRNIAADASPGNRWRAAYAAYILSLADDLFFATTARNILGENSDDYPAFLAAAALIRGGFASEGVAAFDRAIAARVWENCAEWERAKAAGMALFIACRTGHGDVTALTPAALRLNAMLRSDGSAWGTTRDNAWATLGLAPFAARVGAGFGTGTVSAGAGDPESFDASEKPVKVKRDPAAPVEIKSEGVIFASVSTVGVPAAPPADSGPVAITRRYVDSKGNAVKSVKRGDLVTAVIEIRSPRTIENAVIADLIPGGFEVEDASFSTRSTLGGYTLPAGTPSPGGFREIRNDRWLWYGDISTPGADGRPQTLTYHLRAAVPGSYAIPSGTVEAMYDPDLFGRCDAAGRIEVK